MEERRGSSVGLAMVAMVTVCASKGEGEREQRMGEWRGE